MTSTYVSRILANSALLPCEFIRICKEGATGDEPKTDLPQPTREEMLAAFSGPAVFANKVYLSLVGPNARLAFTELTQPDLKPVFRSAVLMTINDLFALQDAIENLRKLATLVEVKQEDKKPA
jgi:hypothetical protein